MIAQNTICRSLTLNSVRASSVFARLDLRAIPFLILLWIITVATDRLSFFSGGLI